MDQPVGIQGSGLNTSFWPGCCRRIDQTRKDINDTSAADLWNNDIGCGNRGATLSALADYALMSANIIIIIIIIINHH